MSLSIWIFSNYPNYPIISYFATLVSKNAKKKRKKRRKYENIPKDLKLRNFCPSFVLVSLHLVHFNCIYPCPYLYFPYNVMLGFEPSDIGFKCKQRCYDRKHGTSVTGPISYRIYLMALRSFLVFYFFWWHCPKQDGLSQGNSNS